MGVSQFYVVCCSPALRPPSLRSSSLHLRSAPLVPLRRSATSSSAHRRTRILSHYIANRTCALSRAGSAACRTRILSTRLSDIDSQVKCQIKCLLVGVTRIACGMLACCLVSFKWNPTQRWKLFNPFIDGHHQVITCYNHR